MDEHGGAAGAETSGIGAAAAPGRERRMTARRKQEAVLRVLSRIEERKRRLADLVAELADPALQPTDGIAEGKALFELVKARGMEGIVAKRLGSPYAPGRRSGAWVKVKVPGYAPDRGEWFRQANSELGR